MQLDVDRLRRGLLRRTARVIGERHEAMLHDRVLHQEPRQRRRPLGRLALREGVQQFGDVHAPVGEHDRIDVRRLEVDLGERQRRPDDALGELEVDKEAIEAEQRASVGLRQPEVLDVDLQQQRVDPDLADLCPPLELLLDVARHVRGDEPRHEEEPGQCVGDKNRDQHRERDEDPPAREHRPDPRPPSRLPGCHTRDCPWK